RKNTINEKPDRFFKILVFQIYFKQSIYWCLDGRYFNCNFREPIYPSFIPIRPSRFLYPIRFTTYYRRSHFLLFDSAISESNRRKGPQPNLGISNRFTTDCGGHYKPCCLNPNSSG